MKNDYINISILEMVLTDYFETSLDEIKNKINNVNVELTEDEIKNYIDLKKKESSQKRNRYGNLSLEERGKITRFETVLIERKYYYEPYTYQYFSRTIDVLKEKINNLLFIIENISRNELENIKMLKYLREFDINVDNKKILKSDVVRIIEPTIYNIKLLYEVVDRANDINTYLVLKVLDPTTNETGITEAELYPSNKLQFDSLKDNELHLHDGYIQLSKKQIEKLKRIDDLYKGVKVLVI